MAIIKDVKYGEDNDLDNAPVLTEEEKHILTNKMAAMDKLLAEQQQAKYKIELLFGVTRSSKTAYPGALSLWISGNRLHGGGDTKMYECPARAQKTSDCLGIIPDSSQGYGHLVCPKCMTVWKGSQVHGEVFARLTTAGWAQLIYRYFRRLDHNCDIYIKAPKHDIRKASALEQNKQMMGEKLHAARTKRSVVIYPLRNIIHETAAGADVLGRFRALLSA